MHTINIVVPPFLCAPGDERMPLGAAYLSSSLKKRKISVNCIDTRFEKVDFDCEFMGITVFSQQFSYVKNLVKVAKEKGIKIIAGGPHCTADPMSLIEIGVDAVVVGEGEHVLPNLIESFEKGVHVADPIVNLDDLPFPDIEFFNKYPWRKDTAWVMTSRGCPNHCSYCQKFFGDKMRLRSVDNVLCEIGRYPDQMIEIVDDAFTVNAARTEAFCKSLPKLNYRLLVIANGTIATTLNEQTIEALARARLSHVMIAQESVDEKVLKLAHRAIYVNDCERVIQWCKKNNIIVGVFMLMGLPGSSYGSDLKGIEWIHSQDVWANYGVAVPFKNTSLWDWVEKHGKWLSDPNNYEDYPPRFEMENYKWEEIQKAWKLALETVGRRRVS